MPEVDGGRITPSDTEPVAYRSSCRLCPWASHVGGTAHDLALAALAAHLEAVHGARHVRHLPGSCSR